MVYFLYIPRTSPRTRSRAGRGGATMVSGRHTGRIRFMLVIALLTVLTMTSGVNHRVVATEEAYETLRVFSEVLTLVRNSYVEQTESQQLIFGAIRGMLETLDPHSSFMPPDVFKEMQIETQGSFGGLGIEITVRDRHLTVVAPLEGTPADRAGIHSGDRITRIDGAPTKDMTLVDAVRKLRGPQGRHRPIKNHREGQEPFDIATTRDLEDELKALREKGLRGLIFDLRNNPGGLLNQAVQMADLFLDKGKLIVYTEGRAKNQSLRFVDERDDPQHFPMVVLINRGSARA